MIKPVSIKNRMIGNGKPCYIIAEVGVNHNGDIEIAQKLIDEAVKAGVDAVKFQIFRTEALITVDAPKAQYQTKTTTKNESQYQMLKNLELSTNEHAKLKD
jgi:sialic acid synthase SpsE